MARSLLFHFSQCFNHHHSPGCYHRKSIVINTPYRNHARVISDYVGNKDKCSLSLSLDSSYDCVPTAPSKIAMLITVNDDTNELTLAQGLVSSGATNGAKGLGKVTMVKKGGAAPGSV